MPAATISISSEYMRASVAYRIEYGFAIITTAAIHATGAPKKRRVANHVATTAPAMKQPDNERDATFPLPNAPVQKWSRK